MPYALCPMPYAQSYLIFLRNAICIPTFQAWYRIQLKRFNTFFLLEFVEVLI
jgi:hypothetical protein